MKTVTICGSMRFSNEMKEIALRLEIQYGFNVLQCVYNPHNVPIDKNGIEALVNAHRRKIDLSDAVYIVDIEGYIGTSVRDEIAYAEAKGKAVMYHSQFEL